MSARSNLEATAAAGEDAVSFAGGTVVVVQTADLRLALAVVEASRAVRNVSGGLMWALDQYDAE